MPVDLAKPVVTAACFFCCRRAMGEATTRHSLRPLRFPRGQVTCNTRARTRRGIASTCSPQGGIISVSLFEGAAGVAKPGAVGLAAIRRPARIVVGPWPLSQSRPNAEGREVSGAPRLLPAEAVDVSRFRCCAKAPVRASHPNQFATELIPPLSSNRGWGSTYVVPF
jgi:hypothetical protein